MFDQVTPRQFLGWSLGLASVFITFVIFYLAFLSDFSFIGENDDINRPCQPSTLEFQCYNINPNTCQTVWKKFAGPCKELVISRFGSGKVTSLIGPSVKRCIYRKFDKTVRATRKSQSASACDEHFKTLDALTMDSFDSSQ